MFWSVYKKEMLDSLRDRKTIILTIMIPIVMICAMVLFYENMLSGSNTAEGYRVAVADTFDEKSFEWLDELPNIEAFRSDDPEQAVNDGEAVAGLWADTGFLEQVMNGGTAEVKMTSDEGSMKGSEATSLLRRGLEALQETITADRLAAAGVDPLTIKPITITTVQLTDKDSNSLNFASILLPVLIIMSVMIGGQSSAVELFAGEKERKTMEALLMTPVSRGQLVLAKWLAIATLGFISGIFSVIGFAVIVSTMTELMKQALDFGSNGGRLLISALLCILLFSLLISAIQIIFSMLANSFKEAQTYFGPVMFIAMVPYILLMGVGVNELSTIHFLIPVMNTYALLKELVYGVFSIGNLVMTIISTAALVTVMYVIAAVMFSKDKWVLGK